MSYKFALTINTNEPGDIAAVLAALNGSTAMNSTAPAAAPAGDDEDDNAPPATVAPGEKDSTGLPYDARIHSKNATKTKEGAWRKVKGVDAALVTAVEAELRAAGTPAPAAAPVTPPNAPAAPTPPAPSPVPDGGTPAVAPVPAPTPVSNVSTPPAAPATPPTPPTAPVAPATPPATPATTTLDFGGLMQVVSNGMTANPVLIDDAFIGWLNSQLGVTQLPEIAADPAKIAQAYQLLVDHKRVVGLA